MDATDAASGQHRRECKQRHGEMENVSVNCVNSTRNMCVQHIWASSKH